MHASSGTVAWTTERPLGLTLKKTVVYWVSIFSFTPVSSVTVSLLIAQHSFMERRPCGEDHVVGKLSRKIQADGNSQTTTQRQHWNRELYFPQFG